MTREVWDETTGERFYQMDDGSLIPAPEAGLLAQAGRQFADIGSGIQSAYGNLTDQSELINQANQDTAERNRLFQGTDLADPLTSMVGQALPGAATAPISGIRAGLALATSEGAFDLGTGGTFAERAGAGALGGIAGEIGGRVLGRVWNTARGLANDLTRATTGTKRAIANPNAQRYNELGGTTLAYQDMVPGSNAANTAERAARGMQTAINPPQIIDDVVAANDKLHLNAVAKAVGLEPDVFDNMGPEFKAAALDRFNQEFASVEQIARGAGELELGEKLSQRLLKNRSIKAAMEEDGLFEGLADGRLAPGEYLEARDGLGDHINRLYSQGENARAIRAEKLLQELDDTMGNKLPDGFKDDFARLREQYRVFSIIEKPNTMAGRGQVNVRTLSNNLNSKTSGFGRTATAGGETTNPETRELLDIIFAADKPEFKAFSSSGTAENLQLGETLDNIADASTALVGGDPMPALGTLARLKAPAVIAGSQAGGGQAFEGMYNPSAAGQFAGRVAGRGALDELFYPFVGIEDDRPQQ